MTSDKNHSIHMYDQSMCSYVNLYDYLSFTAYSTFNYLQINCIYSFIHSHGMGKFKLKQKIDLLRRYFCCLFLSWLYFIFSWNPISLLTYVYMATVNKFMVSNIYTHNMVWPIKSFAMHLYRLPLGHAHTLCLFSWIWSKICI